VRPFVVLTNSKLHTVSQHLLDNEGIDLLAACRVRAATAGAGDDDDATDCVGDEGGREDVAGRGTDELDEDTECPRRRLRASKKGGLAGEQNYGENGSEKQRLYIAQLA
jgi:hypothetical protein